MLSKTKSTKAWLSSLMYCCVLSVVVLMLVHLESLKITPFHAQIYI